MFKMWFETNDVVASACCPRKILLVTIKDCRDWFTPPNAKLERGSASTSVLVPLG